jgi:hypothetical protein
MLLLKSKTGNFQGILNYPELGAGAGAAAAIWICGSVVPELKEISGPQH